MTATAKLLPPLPIEGPTSPTFAGWEFHWQRDGLVLAIRHRCKPGPLATYPAGQWQSFVRMADGTEIPATASCPLAGRPYREAPPCKCQALGIRLIRLAPVGIGPASDAATLARWAAELAALYGRGARLRPGARALAAAGWRKLPKEASAE